MLLDRLCLKPYIYAIFFMASLSSSLVLAAQSVNSVREGQKEKFEYLTLKNETEHSYSNAEIFVLSLPSSIYEKEIKFKNMRVTNLFATRVRKIQNFKAEDVVFYYAKMPGVLLDQCYLKNVQFVQSDLSFLTFKNCFLQNVTFLNSVEYGKKVVP